MLITFIQTLTFILLGYLYVICGICFIILMGIRLLYTIVGVGFVINVIVYVGFVGVLVFVGLIIVVAVLDAGLLVMLSFFIVTRFGIYTGILVTLSFVEVF